MRKMAGTGVPNVFVVGGTVEGPAGSMAYQDLDGLYTALAGAIAARVAPLTAGELRFLRKRMHMTQDDVGALGGKTGQVAAMWEKGSRPVPVAEGNIMRLLWKARHAKRGIAAAVLAIAEGDAHVEPCAYVLRHVDGAGWQEDIECALALASQQAAEHTTQTIALAMRTSTVHRTTAAAAWMTPFPADAKEIIA